MAHRALSMVGSLGLLGLVCCTSGPRIHDRPIQFSSTRQEATRSYIGTHYGLQPESITIIPRMIVLHWTGINGFEESFAAFDPEMLGNTRPDLNAAGGVNVSIHFLVDRDGTVYRLMPEEWMARHVIGLNHSAIGIENVGGGNSIDNLTDAQVTANIQLVRHLANKYSTIRYLIGHMEYRSFEGTPLWLELDETYRTEKVDPGDRFMAAVREGVADLSLADHP